MANVVEYQPAEPNRYKIQKLVSRIKAEEEIWNKVADEIFDLDSLVRRDKKISHLSPFVKDVFGIKIVVWMPGDVTPLHNALCEVTWNPETLLAHQVPIEASTEKIHFIETKNYLGQAERKASRWEAYKSVVHWWEKTFEIQIQPLRNYHHEREYLTKESHEGFKARRESLRNQIAAQIPLFGFCRDLLKWLFMAESHVAAPGFPGVSIQIED